MKQIFPLSRAAKGRWARVVVMGFVIFLVGQYWHPYYGFTSLLQADPTTAANLPSSLRDGPIFFYRDTGRYDGAYYAQIASSPALRDPALATAVDDLGYRARRILLSATAWLLGGGDPIAAVHWYSWLNPLLWLTLAALSWRLFPVDEWRGNLGWIGLVLAKGVLASVRMSLTDLGALVLLMAVVMMTERRRATMAAALLGFAGLARETALLGIAALPNAREWRRLAGWLLLAFLPLAGWLAYLKHVTAGSGVGANNFALPLVGWLGRAHELALITPSELNWVPLVDGILEYVALTVQVFYLIRYPEKISPWWRTGLLYALLGIFLGHAVWEGFPGAAARILLPMTLAFNVLIVRRKDALAWLLLGNLSIFGGVSLLLDPPRLLQTLDATTGWNHYAAVEVDGNWWANEWNHKWHWAWCKGEGGMTVRVWPGDRTVRMELRMSGVTPRDLEIRHAGQLVWSGPIGDHPQWIALPPMKVTGGRLQLELRSAAPPTQEGANETARQISFACFGARLAD